MSVMRLYAGPTVEAVTLEEAKLHLRVDQTAEDDLIQAMVEQARNWIEELYNLALVNQTWDLYLEEFPGTDELIVPKLPLSSVTGVFYTAYGSAEATYSSSNYVVDAYRQPGRIKLISGASWPGDELIVANGVRVRVVCGFGAAGSSVPRMIRQALLLLVGHWYENREATYQGKGSLDQIPMGVDALLWNWKAKTMEF